MSQHEQEQRQQMAALGVESLPGEGSTTAWKRALVLGAQNRRN